jgi:hypothetical protein
MPREQSILLAEMPELGLIEPRGEGLAPAMRCFDDDPAFQKDATSATATLIETVSSTILPVLPSGSSFSNRCS